nr:hypothetical protein [Nostoc sp. EkiNYC01]
MIHFLTGENAQAIAYISAFQDFANIFSDPLWLENNGIAKFFIVLEIKNFT